MKINHSKPDISHEDIEYVKNALFDSLLSTGTVSKELALKFSKLLHRKYSICVNSGTSAIHLALNNIIKDELDEVIIPGYSCVDLQTAVNLTKGKIVLCDSDSDGNIDEKHLIQLINKNTKAVILQHTFGKEKKLDPKLFDSIVLIEDCSHRIFPSYNTSDVVISLGATKPITAAEGGVYLTNSRRRGINSENKLLPNEFRLPYRQSDIHASLALSQIKKIQYFREKRWKIYNIYKQLAEKNSVNYIKFTEEDFVYRFVIKLSNAKEQKNFLEESKKVGINCEKPILPTAAALKLPGVERCYRTFVSIPLYPALEDDEIEYITEKTTLILNECKGAE